MPFDATASGARPTSPVPGIKHVPIPADERRRVLWRDAGDLPRSGVLEWRALMGGRLVSVLVRCDHEPRHLARVSPNDLQDLGPAGAPAPFPPASARPVFAVVHGGA